MGRLHDAAVAAIVGAIVGATRRTSVYKRQLSARLSAQLKAVAPIDRADSCMSVYVQNTLDKPDQTLSVGDPALRQSLCDRICTQRLFLLNILGQLLVFLSDLAVLLF